MMIHEESLPREALWVFEHGAYVQDVRYADFAGAKIGDAVIAEKAHF